MISNYAVITEDTNTVVNIIVWDGDTTQWQPPEGQYTVKIEDDVWCNIGAVYDKDTGLFAYPDGYVRPE